MQDLKNTTKAKSSKLSTSKSKLWNLVHYHGKFKIATLHWQLPYSMIRDKMIKAKNDPKYPRGSYFIPEQN